MNAEDLEFPAGHFDRVIGGKYGLSQAQQALDDVAALRVTKAVIDPRLG